MHKMGKPSFASRVGSVRWDPAMLRPFLMVMCSLTLGTMMIALFNNMEWRSFKHMAFDRGYSHVDVIKSQSDSRDYRFFVLPNGLQVLAVSDPTADRVAASMDVSVGHFSDPEELPGLAHFLEHMLFMGSQKYPDENQYSAFLSQHGGSSNAYTAAENTNYQFQITPDYFEQALDIFAQFFVSPLLKAESTVREVNAVENEHIKNLQSDGWRANQLRKSMSNPKHPNHKFGTGNLQTLCNSTHAGNVENKCSGTLVALKTFYKRHYIAPRMRLCVVAKDSLEKLEDMVRGSFSDVPGAGGISTAPFWSQPVRPPGTGARIFKYVPITDQRTLSLVWTLPSMLQHFRSKPASYLSHMVGHEAEGSVAALLKKRGLIESLSSGADEGTRYAGEFEVAVSLTPKGLERVDEVIDAIFAYMRLLRTSGVQKWVWTESKALADMHFRFKEKSEPVGYAVGLASALQVYPPKYAISAAYTYEKYEPKLIEDMFAALTPENVDIYICAQKFAGGKGNQREVIYGTEYHADVVEQASINRWSSENVDPELHLVLRNEYIPTDFSLVPRPAVNPMGASSEGVEAPEKVIDKAGMRLWYKQDYDTKGKNWKAMPKLSMMFQISTTVAANSPRHAVMTQLFTMLYSDAMTLKTYDASVAGLSWGLSPSDDSMVLSVGGYSQKLPKLLKLVTENLVNCAWAKTRCVWSDQNRFETMKDELRRALENSKKNSPYQRAMESFGRLMRKRSYSTDRLLYELSLPSVSLDDMREHVKELFAKVHVEGLVHGNAPKQVAIDSMQMVMSALGSAVLPDGAKDMQEIVQLDQGYVYAEPHTNPDDLNHALELYYQWPERGIKHDVIAALFGEMISEPCFDTLRTKEQLGYIVACRSRPLAGSYPPAVNGLAILIQSSFKAPHHLDNLARHFVRGFISNMTVIDTPKFEAHKAALLAQIKEKDKTVHEETGRFWSEIIKRRYDWNRMARLEHALGGVTALDVLSYGRKLTKIEQGSLAVWVYGKGQEPPEGTYAVTDIMGPRHRIHSISSYKQSPPKYFPCSPPNGPPSGAAPSPAAPLVEPEPALSSSGVQTPGKTRSSRSEGVKSVLGGRSSPSTQGGEASSGRGISIEPMPGSSGEARSTSRTGKKIAKAKASKAIDGK